MRGLLYATIALCSPLFVGCGASMGVRHFNAEAMGKLSNNVSAIAASRNGVWVATDNGLGRYSDGRWITKWKGWSVTAAAPIGPNRAWVGVEMLKRVVSTKAQMREARVYHVKEKRDEIIEAQEGNAFPGDRVQSLFVDRRKGLWVGLRQGGIYYLQSGGDELKSLLGNEQLGGYATSFAEGGGTLYVGTFGGGVVEIRNKKVVKRHTPKNSKLRGNGVVRSLAYHPSLGLLAATANKLPGKVVGDDDAQAQGAGVSVFKGGKWSAFGGGGLKSNDVSRIAVAPDGAVWFLTLNAGAALYRGGKWSYPKPASDTAIDISFQNPRSVWIGTNGGASLLQGY